ncbi:MAG TPA: serine/threonine-protein kinase [Gemmatimonadales bacterium]|nr:serine/threonine-protein kinase [Gemmatimonadales bacterium]
MAKTDRLSRVSKFELHDLIGEGATGVVWKAYDTVIRRFVALKLLTARIGKSTDARERFLREARAAGVLQHPNLITLYDLGEADGQLYIAMELVQGRDLSDIIASGAPLALERKLDLAIQMLDGLAHAHDHGVIHRDIKPSNVRVASDGQVKIMDFGIARLQSADVTGSGAIVGTPNYMAPEQVTNGAITPATDIFSVGCLLYEFLSSKKPFDGDTVHGVLYQVLTTDPKPLQVVAPSLPAALDRVVAKAMNKASEDRYQSAREMQQTLLEIRAALSSPSGITQRLPARWTPLPAPLLRLLTHTSLKVRVAALATLLTVALVLLYVSRPGAATPPDAQSTASVPAVVAAPLGTAPSGGVTSGGAAQAGGSPGLGQASPPAAPHVDVTTPLDHLIQMPVPAGLNTALAALRDSALEARRRARAAGAMKNNVPSVVLAETMLQTAELGLRQGDQARASSGYINVVPLYGNARIEAEQLRREAERAITRATPVVKGITKRAEATRAATSLARADSLLAAMDYTLAALAAQDAERVGVAVGVAPPSPQPADPRAAIGVLLLDLARAVASERVANLRLLFPSMTAQDAGSWQRFFRRASRLEARFTATSLHVAGSTASATVRAEYRFVATESGVQQEERTTLGMEFMRTLEDWRVTRVSELKR